MKTPVNLMETFVMNSTTGLLGEDQEQRVDNNISRKGERIGCEVKTPWIQWKIDGTNDKEFLDTECQILSV